MNVATVLTACGIETSIFNKLEFNIIELQQYLPLAVLKPAEASDECFIAYDMLQQYLPLAVLKLVKV